VTQPDPEFVALHKAIYGESVDVREAWEIAKFATNAPDVHTDTQTKRQRKMALTGLGASGIATVGGLHAIKSTLGEAREKKKAAEAAGVARTAGKYMRRLPVSPARAAQLGTAGWLGLHGVELVGDALALHAQQQQARKPVVNAPAKAKVKKAARMRLKPVNAGMVQARVPSLRARRPRSSPGPFGKSFDAEVEIAKIDPYKHQVFGWAQVANWDGEEVHDRQGDVVSIEELEKAAYNYVLDVRVGGDQHGRVAKSDIGPRQTSTLIESMVFTPEKIEKMGLPADFPQGWWVGYKVHDEQAWDDIINKRRTGLSVHGTGRRELVSKADPTLRQRARVAVHPPPVARHTTPSSTAVASMGYQPQTHRLAYEMRSRPGQPYNYKATKKQAYVAQHNSSIGHHYATEVRGKYKRKEKVNPVDRVRLFANPPEQVGKAADPQVQRRRRIASNIETGASLTGGSIGAAYAATAARKQFEEEHQERYRQMASGVERFGAKGPVRAQVARTLLERKPTLAAFGTLIAAGATAGAAHKYQQASKLREQYQGSELQHRVHHRGHRRARLQPPQPVAKGEGGILTPDQLRRRQRRQALYYKTGATLGLAALGSKVGGASARKFIQPAEKGARIADELERHTTTLLTGGAGLGAISGFNQAKISRTEAAQRKVGA